MDLPTTQPMSDETTWTTLRPTRGVNIGGNPDSSIGVVRQLVTTQITLPEMLVSTGSSSQSATFTSPAGEEQALNTHEHLLTAATSDDATYFDESTVQYNYNGRDLDRNITAVEESQSDLTNNFTQTMASIQSTTESLEFITTSEHNILKSNDSLYSNFNLTETFIQRGTADNATTNNWWSNNVTYGIHTTSSSGPEVFSDWGTKSWTEFESVHQASSGNRVGLGIGDRQPFDSAQELIFKVSVLVLISVFGSVGNLLVIGSIIKTRHLHRPPFYFLLSMAATDLSRAGFCVPVIMATTLQGSTWGHGSAACKLFAFATSFFVFSSTLSLLAIAIERHASIVYSKTYRRRCHGLIILIVAIFIWIIAFCISFPPVVGAGEYVFIQEEAQCAFKHKHYAYSDGAASVMLFLAIMFLTYFLYFRIYRFMRSHRRMRPLQHQPARSSNWTFVGPGANGQAFINWLNGFGGQTVNRQTGQRTVQRLNFGRVVNLSASKNEHLTRSFLTLTCVFGFLWVPYVIVSLWRIFLDQTLLPSGFVTSAAWTSYSQVALSPLTYFLARGKVRRSARTIQACADDRKEFLLENKTRK